MTIFYALPYTPDDLISCLLTSGIMSQASTATIIRHNQSPKNTMSYNQPITRWQGLSVWLIGASTGIGEALARDLSAAGAQVILSARSEAALTALSAQLPLSVTVPFDFTDAQQTAQAWLKVQAAAGLLGKQAPDVTIINAGTYIAMPARQFDAGKAQQQFAVNIGGPLNTLHHVLPAYTQSASGHIVFVSSVAGYRGLPRALAYGGSKAALTYMAQCLYLEIGHKGTGISVVCPGFVSTSLTEGNRFHMPALLTPQQASTAILKGLKQGEFEIHFPKRFTWFLKLLRCLPFWAYVKLVRRTL
jgi:short-subunit dehydrogenase